MWKKILFQVLDGVQNIQSPFHKEGVMKSVFVALDKETRLGFLWIWCSKTHKGINMSRIEAPPDLLNVSPEEFKSMDIPEIQFVDPNL